tara:strand:+ start:399 stop:575 length:177 start_codon:yes stop_codon:yes gene_type:complete
MEKINKLKKKLILQRVIFLALGICAGYLILSNEPPLRYYLIVVFVLIGVGFGFWFKKK